MRRPFGVPSTKMSWFVRTTGSCSVTAMLRLKTAFRKGVRPFFQLLHWHLNSFPERDDDGELGRLLGLIEGGRMASRANQIGGAHPSPGVSVHDCPLPWLAPSEVPGLDR